MNFNFHKNIVLRAPLKPLKTRFSKEDLKQLFSKKDAQEALFLSSPDLLNKYQEWINNEIKDQKKEEKIIYSLLKYAIRFHSRSTPFGLFAGCDVVEFGEKSEIVLLQENLKRSTRLDMNFTCALAQDLSNMDLIRPHLKFYPNTSLYDVQDKVRYVEYVYKNNRRIHSICAVDSSIFLNKIIEESKKGVLLIDLANTIVDDEITFQDSFSFVLEMINEQLLVSELEPSVTGEESLIQILNVLEKIHNNNPLPKFQQVIEILRRAQKEIEYVDLKIGNEIEAYQNIAHILSQLNIPFELNKLFQADLYINATTSSKLSESVQIQLKKALRVLNCLTKPNRNTNLHEFKRKFYERYENREVSLLEVLDNEIGIGYAKNNNNTGDVNPLIDDLVFPYGNANEGEIKWDDVQTFLFRKLLKANQENHYSISLSETDVKDFSENWNDLPNSFSLKFSHLGRRNGEDFLSLQGVGGGSATKLLGRFALDNKKIAGLVKEIVKAEKELSEDLVLAEIVHLPENRVGNILMRPAFRDYEILFLSNSTLPKNQQIKLDDLYISLKNNRLILRSKRLKKEVVPYLGNTHNYMFNSLPCYHFLCDLQSQNLREGIFFNWGNMKSHFTFLPRVEVENVVISSATWQLNKINYQSLIEEKNDPLIEIRKMQEIWKWPDLIFLVDGDNELLINLKDELSINMFIAELKKRPFVILKEFLFDKTTSIVKNEQGVSYANEFIATLIKSKQNSNIVTSRDFKNSERKIERNFSLGSNWLYYKIYSGVKTADKLLTDVIRPLVEELIERKLIDSWFFIRYGDPEKHIRVRFHLLNIDVLGEVIRLFQKAIFLYEKEGLVWKIQTDTYQREVERYGENTMELSERLFYFDSNCTVNMLDLIHGDQGEDVRWLFGIKAVDELLSDFNYLTEEKMFLLEHLKNAFASEFNVDKNLKLQMDKKFRIHRNNISSLLNNEEPISREMRPFNLLIEKRSQCTKSFVESILKLQGKGELEVNLNDLLASLIHMMLNRLFKNKQRFHEMVVYDYLWRTYKSEVARKKQKCKLEKN